MSSFYTKLVSLSVLSLMRIDSKLRPIECFKAFPLEESPVLLLVPRNPFFDTIFILTRSTCICVFVKIKLNGNYDLGRPYNLVVGTSLINLTECVSNQYAHFDVIF